MPDIKDIYRKESLENLHTIEEFTAYIHQPKLKWWVITLILGLFIIAITGWALFSRIPAVTAIKGLVKDENTIICFIPLKDLSGKDVDTHIEININGRDVEGTAALEKEFPLSSDEIKALLNSDWLFDNLVSAQFSYYTRLTVNNINEPIGSICSVALTTGYDAPIKLLENNI